MVLKIETDHTRFKKIVRGKIKNNLRKYITQGELIGKQGKHLISIPMPQIDLPTFRYDPKSQGGVGRGEGEPGTVIGTGDDGAGTGEAGNAPGAHILEVEVTLDELAEILGEELELPNIQPRGKKTIQSIKDRYTSIHRSGPESLRHFKRTYREALKRQIASGLYDYIRPRIIPIHDDKRYRAWKSVPGTESNAVIIYIMDISGSMWDEQKDIVRLETFWIDTWLRSQYKGIETRYIVHDAAAKEVDRDSFFRLREGGGTVISSAYLLCQKIIETDYPPEEWNIYPFHFSDGDNWSKDDTRLCLSILDQHILPKVNLFCYGQVESPYGSGQFLKEIEQKFRFDESISTSLIRDKDEIFDSIKKFLGKGK